MASFSCGSYGCSAFVEFSSRPTHLAATWSGHPPVVGWVPVFIFFVETTSTSSFSRIFAGITALWAYGCFQFGTTTSYGFARSFLRFDTLIFGGYCFRLLCTCSYVSGVATAPHLCTSGHDSAVTKTLKRVACAYIVLHADGVAVCFCLSIYA